MSGPRTSLQRRLFVAGPPPDWDFRGDLVTAAHVATAQLALTGLIASVVALLAARPTRRWLGFTFPGVEDRLTEVAAILANNLRVLAAVLVATAVAQLAIGAWGERPSGATGRATLWFCDSILATAVGVHVLLVGAALGAYGGRVAAALVPHGPIELAAYSLALALYLAARRERVAPRRWLVVGAASACGLVSAAPLEVFVAP